MKYRNHGTDSMPDSFYFVLAISGVAVFFAAQLGLIVVPGL